MAIKQITVLIVDDHPDILRLFRAYFSFRGTRAFTAATCGIAKIMAADIVPDVILLDNQLPDGRGLDIVPDLKNGNSPIIFLITGDEITSQAEKAMALGVTKIFQKPCTPRTIYNELSNILPGLPNLN